MVSPLHSETTGKEQSDEWEWKIPFNLKCESIYVLRSKIELNRQTQKVFPWFKPKKYVLHIWVKKNFSFL